MTHLPQLPSQRTPQPCVMQVVRVSGTIRKAEEEVIKRARVAILKARNDSQGGGSGGLDAILGPSIGGVSSKNHERDTKPVVGIEDKDDDDDEDASGVSMDEG